MSVSLYSQLTKAKKHYAGRIAIKDQNSNDPSNQNKKVKAKTRWTVGTCKKRLTVGALLIMGLSVELSVQSSGGGGNTFPDRRCILVVAPVIC